MVWLLSRPSGLNKEESMNKYQNDLKGASDVAWEIGCDLDEEYPSLKELVDKTIPIKIHHFDTTNFDADVVAFNLLNGFCPKCLEDGKRVIVGLTDKYCLYCGQRLEKI